ncbi:MAG: hypothetical protein M3R49_06875 [Chloroflexota bacterium]|nr:hypothetical protein [Chloroflexota bacterium]
MKLRTPLGSRRRGAGALTLSLLFILCAGCSATNVASPSSSVQASNPTPVASAPPSGPPAAWTRVATFGDTTATHTARHVVYGTAGFLAIGDRQEGFEGGPQITRRYTWASPDGLAWEEIAMPAQLTNGSVNSLITTPDGDYVLYADFPTTQPGIRTPPALRSSDGRTWDAVQTGLPQGLFIKSIERGKRGYLLAGYPTDAGNPTLWLSKDGVAWEQVHEFSQDQTYVDISDAGAGDEGFVVFGVRTDRVTSHYQRFTFASSDGRAWVDTRAPFGPDPQDYRPDVRVTGFGPDWIATVASKDDSAHFWFSADGIAWKPLTQIDRVGSTMVWDPILGAANGRLFFSASSSQFPPGNAVGGAWTSADGLTWEAIDLGGVAYPAGVAEGGGVVVLAGTVAAQDRRSSVAALWAKAAE